MQTISREHAIYTFSADYRPVLEIQNGDVVCLETQDCFSGNLSSGVWRFTDPIWENPATGPVWVKGAHPGAMLRIEVLEIELAEFGVVESVVGRGCLGQYIRKNCARVVPICSQKALLSETLQIPLAPMIGVLGVAPAEGAPKTMLPGDHGGNMDCARIGPGSVVYLPVFTEGALLAAGDLHGAMGDGEIGVSGLEVAGKITLRLTAVDSLYLPFPLVFSNGRVHAVASARSLDDACAKAAQRLYQFLAQTGCIPEEDITALMTLAANVEVCQMVNELRTACMSLSTDYFHMDLLNLKRRLTL